MMIFPRRLQGTLKIPSSKSMGHRMVIAAALSGGGKVENLTVSADIQATLQGMKALGADYRFDGNTARFENRRDVQEETVVIDCNESGSTLRFLLPVAVALCPQKTLIFKGRGRLLERPLEPYFALFDEMGIQCRKSQDGLTVQGILKSGECRLSGKISSQFITGLLYALPLLTGDSKIVITDRLESKGYVDMTLEALTTFGIKVENRDYREFIIPGGQRYLSKDTVVEGDYSQAAFFYAANFIGGDVLLKGLNPNSSQGDRAVEAILADFAQKDDCELDVSDIPDLVPALAAAAAYRKSDSVCQRLPSADQRERPDRCHLSDAPCFGSAGRRGGRQHHRLGAGNTARYGRKRFRLLQRPSDRYGGSGGSSGLYW